VRSNEDFITKVSYNYFNGMNEELFEFKAIRLQGGEIIFSANALAGGPNLPWRMLYKSGLKNFNYSWEHIPSLRVYPDKAVGEAHDCLLL
jgi:hypothetical protein